MKAIVLLDFCDTLVNFQTFDPYVKKVILAYYPRRERWLNNKIIRFVSKLLHHFNKDYYLYKHYLVKLTTGIPETVFRQIATQYYQELLRPNIIQETESIVKQFIEEGYEVIILSGGCDLYIKKFVENYRINKVIATEILFREGKSTGKIINDCIGHRKLKMLKEQLGQACLEEYNIIGLTDSQTDLPMLSICGKKIIISKDKHQSWVSEDMDEVVWHRKREDD